MCRFRVQAPPSEGASVPLKLGRRSHEVPLAELDAALTQDVVGSRGMKIEVRQEKFSNSDCPENLRSPLANFIVISLSSLPSICAGLIALMNSIVLATRSSSRNSMLPCWRKSAARHRRGVRRR